MALGGTGAWLVEGHLSSLPDLASQGAWLSAIWLRAGSLLACWAGLAAHGSVLRGELRRVWSTLPVDSGRVVRQELREVLPTAFWLWLGVSFALVPTAWHGSGSAWVLGTAGVGLGTIAALLWSARALLWSVSVAEDDRWAVWLDRVRGANPRPQAAILWSLAPVVLGVGAAMIGVAEGVGALAREGGGLATWGVMLPMVALGVVGAWGLEDTARAGWWRATLVLEEIRARYAMVERPEEVGRVPFDGLAARLSQPLAVWTLHELRYGWRQRRGWVNAAWVFGLAALVAGWTDAPEGWRAAAGWAGLAAWVPATVPLWASAEESPWFRLWLADRPWRRATARVLVVLAWCVGPVALASGAVAMRAGLAGGAMVGGLGFLGVLLASVWGAVWAARRDVTGYSVSAAPVALGWWWWWIWGGVS